MLKTGKEKWLLLDDNRADRMRGEQAIATWTDVEIIQAATIKEVSEILQKEHVSLCLLDFYLVKDTSETLIAQLRKDFPNLPIVVVSGETGKDERIYSAGADAIAPKTLDMSAFAAGLRNAIFHARTVRHLDRLRVKWRQPWLGESVKREFKKNIERSKGNVLIISAPGMGRTTLARTLAKQIRVSQSDLYGQKPRTLVCSTFNLKNTAAFDEALFGSPSAQEGSAAHRGILAASEEAVLIIDDAHLLPTSVQKRLKAFFETGCIVGNSGQRIEASQMRVIFTSLQFSEMNRAFVPGFLQTIIASRICIPSFALLARKKKKILAFWLKRKSTDGKKFRLQVDARFLKKLFTAVDNAPNRVSMRSFAKTVEDAISQALSENRTLVTACDLGEMIFLYEAHAQVVLDTQEKEPELQELIDAAKNETIEDATRILRRVMVERALRVANGSKSKAALALGIARQSLYSETFL